MSVLCLLANPAEPILSPEIVAAVQNRTGGEVNWLGRSVACEIIGPGIADPLETARNIIKTEPLDVALISGKNRRKKLLLADMDSTMIEQECIDELANALGRKSEVAEITSRAMRGEMDFSAALKQRVKLLKGLSRKTVHEIRRENITLAPGGRVLVQTMKAYGAYSAMLSGGFTIFSDYFGKRIGFDQTIANTLVFDDDDLLTGAVTAPIIDGSAKAKHLHKLTSQLNLSINDSLAVGDGANDLEMLDQAGLGVALHANTAVARIAPIALNYADLSALLYLQGYSEEEFIR